MKKGLEKILKKGWKLVLLGATIKIGTVVLQSDTPLKNVYEESVQEKMKSKTYNSDTTNLKRDYLFYDLCKEY